MADSVEKVFFARRMKFSRTADASRTRRREGPHHFRQKRPRTRVSALWTVAATEIYKNRLSRDFGRRSIFDFYNSIGTKPTFTLSFSGFDPSETMRVHHNPAAQRPKVLPLSPIFAAEKCDEPAT
jgi:hypothetical protein